MVEGSDLISDENARFVADGTAAMVIRRQNYSTLMNALPLCMFSHIGFAQFFTPKDYIGITGKEAIEWFNLATGSEHDLESLLKTGEKIFNLKHMINLNRGLDSSSDRLPDRLATVTRKQSAAAGHLPHMEKMMEDYYRIRGWEPDGNIKPEKLRELGL